MADVVNACWCDLCSDVALAGRRTCELCSHQCSYTVKSGTPHMVTIQHLRPIEERAAAHGVHATQLEAKARDTYIRHAAVKLGGHALQRTVDPEYLAAGKMIVETAWKVAQLFRRR